MELRTQPAIERMWADLGANRTHQQILARTLHDRLVKPAVEDTGTWSYDTGAWSSGLYACCEDWRTCLAACCFPWCLAAPLYDTAHATDSVQESVGVSRG